MDHVKVRCNGDGTATVSVTVPCPTQARLDEFQFEMVRGRISEGRVQDCILEELILAAAGELRDARESVRLDDKQLDQMLEQQKARLERLKRRPRPDRGIQEMAKPAKA